jgi:predicted amidophosphoribosyltransferase
MMQKENKEAEYLDSRIYQFRFCTTCKFVRPPLASHCNYCNACVYKFDHHCQVINACVGVRNHKAFVVYLYVTFLSFAYLTCFTLYEIIWQDML